MKIAVTGASGNLGQRVSRIAIAHGHRVVAVDKVPPTAPPQIPEGESKEEWYRFVEIDVRNYGQVLDAFRGCDAVIHLAAIPNPGDYVVDTHNLNVVSSWNALRAAAELGIERICQASSINAVGLVWGDNPIIDYLPMDEKHPCRPEDPYSLSKLVSEMQADTIVRRWPNIRIASIRLAWAVPNREYAMGRPMDWVRRELWAWVDADESARAFVLGVTSECEGFKGHHPFFIIAPTTCQDELTAELVAEHWPNAELRKEFTGIESLYDCTKAAQLLGWVHASPAEETAVPQETAATKAADAEEVVAADAVSPAGLTTSEAHDATDAADALHASSSTELADSAAVTAEPVAPSADSVDSADSAVLEPATDVIEPVVIVSTVEATPSKTAAAESTDEEPSPASTTVEPAPAEVVEPSVVLAAVASHAPTEADNAVSAPAEEPASSAEPTSVATRVEAAPSKALQEEAVAGADPAEVPSASGQSEIAESGQFEQESSSSSELSSDDTSAEGDIDGESALSTDPSEVEVEQQIETKLIAAIHEAVVAQVAECAATDNVPEEHLAPPVLAVVEPVAP